MGDSFFIGDVEFNYYVFYCSCCNKGYEIKEIKIYERKNKEIEIREKYKNKLYVLNYFLINYSK
jgi:hypothetical protein